MRTRIDDKRTTYAKKWRWGELPNNPNPPWSTDVAQQGEVCAVVDEVNSRFQERSKRGEVINTPFRLVRTATVPSMGPYLSATSGSKTLFGDLTATDFPSASQLPYLMGKMPLWLGLPNDHTDMRTRVGTSAMARVAGAKYPGLVSAGELGETLRYLRNPIASGLKLASAIERKLSRRVLKNGKYQPGLLAKQLDQRPSKSISEELSSLYLETMYGMRPLVREISDLAEALTAQAVTYPRETVRSQEDNTWQGSLTRVNSESGITFNETLEYSRKVVVRAGCMYHFYSELDSSNREWGVRLTDVPSALWALTPSSFVVDWFLNTNQVIAALTPIHGLVKDAVWTSVSIEETLYRKASGYNVTKWPTTTSSGGTSSSSIRTIRKERSPTIIVGLAPTKITSGLVDLSLSQTTSLMAMLTQRMVPLIRDLGKSHAIMRGLK